MGTHVLEGHAGTFRRGRIQVVSGPEAGNIALGHSRMLKELLPTAQRALVEKNK